MPLGYGGNKMNGGGAGGGGGMNGLADPHLKEGGDFYPVDLGGGNILALCPACFKAAAMSIMRDMEAAGVEGVNWNSVNWNSVNWNSVNWNSVNWNSVNWNSVNWNSTEWAGGYKTWGW